MIYVSNGQATVVIPVDQSQLDFYVIASGDTIFEVDEDVILAIAQAYSGTTTNQVDCVDADVDPVDNLQALEFISGSDPIPLKDGDAISGDCYYVYLDSSSGGFEVGKTLITNRLILVQNNRNGMLYKFVV